MPIRHRKTVSVDVLRELLGNNQADALLEKVTPQKPTVPVGLAELSLAGKLYADPLTESKSWRETSDVVRRYFLERGQARRGFRTWIQQTLEAAPDGINGASASAPRARRKVTDPAVLEKRRASLAKARAARSRKHQEQ